MKVLEYNQKWLRWIGLLSKRLDEPTNDFFNSPNAYIMIISMAFTMPICGAYGVYLSREDLVRMLQAVYIVSAGIQCVGSYTSVGKNMKLVKSFINDLQNLSDNGKYFPLFSSPKNFLPLFFPLQRFFSRFFSPLKVKNVPISSRKFRFPHKKIDILPKTADFTTKTSDLTPKTLFPCEHHILPSKKLTEILFP